MSWLKKLQTARTLEELDRFGLYLANVGHKWTSEERKTYESRVREFKQKLKK